MAIKNYGSSMMSVSVASFSSALVLVECINTAFLVIFTSVSQRSVNSFLGMASFIVLSVLFAFQSIWAWYALQEAILRSNSEEEYDTTDLLE